MTNSSRLDSQRRIEDLDTDPSPLEYGEDVWGKPWLAVRASRSPDEHAIELGDQTICYADLGHRVEVVVKRLAELGVQRGDVVAIHLPNGIPIVVLIHAGFIGDFVVLPINTRLTAKEIEFQLLDSGTRFLIHAHDDVEAERIELGGRVERIRIREVDDILQLVSANGHRPPVPGSKPIVSHTRFALRGPRFILYTSGTTGKPKGVVLSAENFLSSARGSAALLGSAETDRWLLCLPIFHVGGLSILLRSVLAGSSVVLHQQFSPEAVNADLDARGVTGISVVGTMLKRILDTRTNSDPPSSLQCVLLGGGPAPGSLLRAAQVAGFPVAPTYGLTEAASQVATRLPSDSVDSGLRPLRGTEIEIQDEAGRTLPNDRPGEICVRGDTVTKGYWNQPVATREVLHDGWFHTGDIGSVDRDGRLFVHDRRSDLIVSGGENIYPAEVESVLLEHPAIAEAGVAGRADGTFGARPVAWLVATDEDVPDSRALIAHCRSKLAGYKCPVEFFWVRALPRTATGKLLRRKLGSR
jgi:O-succinylbenzoic acid--CoA ligase